MSVSPQTDGGPPAVAEVNGATGGPDTEATGAGQDGQVRSYHGQPVIKEPVWTWEIPCYLFAGGLAGASAGLAYLTELRGNDVLARRAWATALVANSVSPLLLSLDLGKPMRALNMFRMFKITSPMSVGSWILLANGNCTGVAAANAWLGVFPGMSRAARPAAAFLGLTLSTYTGALLADTAIPVWHEARLVLPSVFASGAALSAGAACMAATPLAHAKPARRLALAGAVLESGLQQLMETSLGPHGKPYKQGASAKFRNVSRACVLAGAALLAWRGGSSRAAAIGSGTLLCSGALSARWSVFRAGFQSASDPKYVVGPQRGLIERGERRGAARRESKIPEPDPSIGSPATLR